MARPGPSDDLAAGGFSAWRRAMLAALDGEAPAEVACGGCTACCRSSMFVHVGPEEVETIRRVPRELLFPAPGRPEGHLVIGYDEHGDCPLLVDDRCSVYEHRPRACRTFDCRVFPAAGVFPDDKPLLARQARRWRFDLPSRADREEQAAVRAAAALLREADHGRPTDATGVALRAVRAAGAASASPPLLDAARGGAGPAAG